MTVNSNVLSLIAQKHLNKSNSALTTSIQRLSSGLRINSAKDDAAGLAISNRFTSQINGTNVAIRNANDAISLAQTGEGALQEYTNILQRMRDLAVQSANDTNSSSDRAAIQSEVEQLKAELNRIGENTAFNGVKLFDGSKQTFSFQTGANQGDTINVTVKAVTTNTIGAAKTAGISSSYASYGTDTTLGFGSASNGNALASGDLVINGIAINASSGDDDGASVNFASSSAIAKAAAVNAASDQTGVTAVVNANTVQGTEITALTNQSAQDFTINGVTIALGTSAGVELKGGLEAIATAINSKQGQTGVTAAVVETENGYRVDLTAEDGRNITIAGGDSTLGSEIGLVATNSLVQTYAGTFTLISDDGSDIKLSTNTGEIDNAGFQMGTFSGSQAQVVGGSSMASDSTTLANFALASGDLVINDVIIGGTLAADDTASSDGAASSAIAKAAAINRVTDQTGVTAVVNANVVSGEIGTSATGSASFELNGVSISVTTTADASETIANFVDAVNAKSEQTGITAELAGTKFYLKAADGRNINLNTATNPSNLGMTIKDPSTEQADISFSVVAADYTFTGSVTLISGEQINIDTKTANISDSGFRVGSFGSQEAGQLIKDVDVSTIAGANKAIQAIDNAIGQVDSIRSNFGAIQNRFVSTVNNLQSYRENLTQARSQIVDTDFAAETAQMTKNQVLQQVGTAMLSQANASIQNVLALLG